MQRRGKDKIKVLVINGPNLNLVGQREPEHYGTKTIDQINDLMTAKAKNYNMQIEFFQSNCEGQIIDKIHQGLEQTVNYIIINAGAFTHYSYAIRDALKGVNIPAIEVHMSNIYNREPFRHHSVLAPVCEGQISGFGYYSYLLALNVIAHRKKAD